MPSTLVHVALAGTGFELLLVLTSTVVVTARLVEQRLRQ